MKKIKTERRPYLWKVQGEIPHQQYLCWLQMRAQASYRKESFELTFEQYQQLWQGKWDQKGRGTDQYCLTRDDPDGPWTTDNTRCIKRVEHLRRQKLLKERKRQWQTSNEE